MSHFIQNNILTFDQAQQRLNDHLNGLEITNIQNGASDTNHLFISIYSKKHEANYYLSIGTDNWIWKDDEGVKIPVFKNEFIDDYRLLAIEDELKKLTDNHKLIIKSIELSEKSKVLKIYFENGSILEAKDDLESEDRSHYQLTLDNNKTYQNYNLVTQNDGWFEEITTGKEKDEKYKVAMFDLEYFRSEHRKFTVQAIEQARLKQSPISFIQARVLYQALTTSIDEKSNIVIFSPWRLRRTSTKATRLDTIPTKELIAITRDECKKNNFTEEEATDILKSTIDSLKEWLKTEKEVETIARQEYGNEGIFRGLVEWYEKTFE